MDKRTLFFIAAFTLTMFLVNTYFDQQNTESKKQWSEQQAAKQALKKRQLEANINERTALEKDLPIANIYIDKELENSLTGGIFIDRSLLIFSEKREIPSKVYAQTQVSSDLNAYTLQVAPKTQQELALYQKSDSGLVNIGSLPSFGKFDLQLVGFNKETHKSEVALGEYTDGHFSLPGDAINKDLYQDSNYIALIKTDKTYLPVGIYHTEDKKFQKLEDIDQLSAFLAKPKQADLTDGKKNPEQFFVLQTPYQQLVFSNYGGALAEINLPFQSDKNPQSVVKEIQFDRDMVKDHPYNAYFPDHEFYVPGSTPQGPFVKKAERALGGYYPLIRRDLLQKGMRQSVIVPPQYYAMNIVSEFPEMAELVYEVKYFDEKTIVFEGVQKHRRITKTFTIDPSTHGAPYIVNLSIKVEGDSRGLWLSSGIPEAEWISAASTPSLKYRLSRGNKSEVNQIDLPKDSLTVTSATPDWLCISNGFLGLILDPLTEIDSGYRVQMIPGNRAPSRLVEIGQDYERFPAQSIPGYEGMLPLKQNGGTMNFRIFAGPFAESILKKVDSIYADPAVGYNPDYISCQSFHGWFAFISEPFAKFLLILMNFFHYLTHSWALSIVLLTVALRLMLYPLNAWSMKSMAKMQQIGPEVTAIQEKYKKEPKKAQLEIMNLYREKGVNPVSGCFPLLIQMPFLIGMFDLLKSTFELRGASFIPGWIADLASPDVLFSWSKPIFFIGNEFHLLPFLLGAVMFLQQRMMSTAPKDVNQMTDQQRQQRVMANVMTVVFTVMFYNFPSGLNLYWLSSMLLGMVQQWWTNKQIKASAAKALLVTPQVELIVNKKGPKGK